MIGSRVAPATWSALVVLVCGTVVAVGASPALGVAGATTRVSVSSLGTQGDGASSDPDLSGDGRYVAFSSDATNLVAGDTNGRADAFLHDSQTGDTVRVSVGSGGTQADSDSFASAISGDGRYVAFSSYATNLVAGDTNGRPDIFVHDRQTGTTTRASVSSGGSQGDDSSFDPEISGDGRHVVFQSLATNLVAGDGNAVRDVFVHDRQTGDTVRVSVGSDGTQADGPSFESDISGDGRYVAFWSHATNLVAGDTNGVSDVFVHDLQAGTTTRVSVNGSGVQGDEASDRPAISADGRFVAFQSNATNLVPGDSNGVRDVFVHDRQTGATTRVSVDPSGAQVNQRSDLPAISNDGRHVAFRSRATNLVTGDTNSQEDVFVHDRETGGLVRASVHSDGSQADDFPRWPALSDDARFVTYGSPATTLVTGDTNGVADVFVHQLPEPAPLDFFTDDNTSIFEADINAIAAAGITRGCNPPDNDNYCPDATVTRGQMAAFLKRALGTPASVTDFFTDDNTSIFEADINAIAAAGITRGCNPPDNDNYCPDATVTRGQMAAFLKRALGTPASVTDFFTDDNTSIFEADINAIAAAGITRGCNPPDNDNYCPDATVTRGQMAAFLKRALLD